MLHLPQIIFCKTEVHLSTSWVMLKALLRWLAADSEEYQFRAGFLKFAFVRGAEALSPSQACPGTGCPWEGGTALRSLHLLTMWSLPWTQRGDSENVSYLLSFTYRAGETQRKRGNSRYHAHVKETDLLFCCLRKPMTSHRVQPYHLPDSLYVLMASFVLLSCRHFGPARLNIAPALTLRDFKTKKLSACGQEKHSYIFLSIFHFFPLSHSGPQSISCWVFCMFHN